MYKLIIATTNPYKVKEIKSLLDIDGLELKSLSDFEDYPSVTEDGRTFEENAAKKVQAYFEFFQKPVIADDSGLEVDALNNEPGIYSARYAGEQATDADNNRRLLEKMKGMPTGQRTARFVCSVCFMDGVDKKIFTGIRKGFILDKLQGREGFGYDPLFFVPEYFKTYAQMNAE
ncbi:MAG TPA: RdgB/HAM1 family non-canonical purine NTP pyrophosphatase, partial [Calditrichaeota bacterium]|nr:RdgB/HAM1 family non-canonical purine NTP pyrophosphatase [Calditrichota bacterium]